MIADWIVRVLPRRWVGDREISLPWENYESRERRRELAEAARRYGDAEGRVLERLRRDGLEVGSLDDLVAGKVDYRRHEDVLLDALRDTPDYGVRETIVRALTIPWAKQSVGPLLKEFRSADAPELYRWAVGNAIEVIAPREVTDEVVELALDYRYGMSRQMIVEALGRTADPAVVEPLVSLLGDRDVQGHAAHALGAVGDARAIAPLQSLTTADRDWVRREAERAIDRIKQRIGPTET